MNRREGAAPTTARARCVGILYSRTRNVRKPHWIKIHQVWLDKILFNLQIRIENGSGRNRFSKECSCINPCSSSLVRA